MNKKPIWIDSDAGVDDAIALFSAFKLNNVDIKGISSVAGNVEEEKTYKNIRDLAHLAKVDAKVYHGATKPMVVELVMAKHVHGENGVGDIELEASPKEHETMLAWDALYQAAVEAKGELEVVTLGPLTNIAIAIAKYPDLETLIKRIYLMGGAIEGGNSTPCAEFNIYVDPHSAEAVFKSKIEKVMFGLDVTLKSSLTTKDIDDIYQQNTKVSKFFYDSIQTCLVFYDLYGYKNMMCLHDVCPVLYLEYPEFFEGTQAGVYVETQGQLTFGKTVSDIKSDFKFDKRDTLVILDVDQQKFAAKIKELLMSY